MHHRLLRALLIVTAGALTAAPRPASAQAARTVYAAIVFNAEAGPRRTSACVQLTERTYPATSWWETETPPAGGADRAFAAVIAAIRKQDRGALLKLTDPTESRDTTRFNQQADAFFQQFQVIRLLAVRHAYEFDGLVVYFGTFQSPSQTAVVPLVFAYEGEDAFGFLPARTRKASFNVVTDWYAPNPAAPPDAPSYCTDAEVRRATHRVAIGASAWRPALLHLTGAPIDASRSLAAPAALVKATIDRMRAALGSADIEAFLRYLTPEGAGRLREWFGTAVPKDRDEYKSAFTGQQPFFVFDESPLLVVYTRPRTGAIQVLYFTFTTDQRLLWTNSSHVTTSDQVFKEGQLFTAAAGATPFSTLVIQ